MQISLIRSKSISNKESTLKIEINHTFSSQINFVFINFLHKSVFVLAAKLGYDLDFLIPCSFLKSFLDSSIVSVVVPATFFVLFLVAAELCVLK